MSMNNWAEREIAAACKRENPNWDGESFDYGCSCYQSALKAYKTLMSDGHSGYSFSITKNILKKLLDEIPLSPITDNDFFINEDAKLESSESLKERGLKSNIQCPRRSSLFRKEDLNGNITYSDINRHCCVNAECPSETFNSGVANFIDKLYPINMPYMPSATPYKVYINYWLTNKTHGDFDVQEVIGYVDLNGKWHDYNKFFYYSDNKIQEITDVYRKMEYNKKRLYSIEDKIADSLIDDIKYIYLTDDMYERNKEKYNKIKTIVNNVTTNRRLYLKSKCSILANKDEHGVCWLNTYYNQHVILNGSDNERAELIKESVYIKDLINVIDTIKQEIEVAVKLK